MTAFAPTNEQLAALEAYATGEDLIIEAGAGAGKSSTLRLLAESTPTRRGQYLAFNRALVEDARGAFPDHVSVSTIHSLAFRAMGKAFSHRLSGPRMRSGEIARRLGVQPIQVLVGSDQRFLAEDYLAGLVMRAVEIFCQSADPEPTEAHFPYVDGIDMPEQNGKRGWRNNREIRRALLPFARRAWEDVQRTDGQLPYRHSHYLKAWELSGPTIPVDVVFFDEAQDVNPVMASCVLQQEHAQRVFVGDQNQAIYRFTGACDAMSKLRAVGSPRTTTLSQSFRFGDAVAEVANRVLETLPTEMRLSGTPSIASVVVPVAEPDAILCRTNACAVQTLLDEADLGRSAHLVGGGTEVIAFARAAEELQSRGRTSHQDLACFESWGQVQSYVDEDGLGGELKLLVNLVDRFGATTIVQALQAMPREHEADVVVSTAHKSKGREWPAVRLAGDFPADPPVVLSPGAAGEDDEVTAACEDERRLLYVAVTRARMELDAGSVPWLVEGQTPDEDDEPATEGAAEPIPMQVALLAAAGAA